MNIISKRKRCLYLYRHNGTESPKGLTTNGARREDVRNGTVGLDYGGA